MSNEIMKLRGFDWDDETHSLKSSPEDLEYEMPHSDITNERAGMPVTELAFLRMLQKFANDLSPENTQPVFRDVRLIEFSKASVFRILSQPNCEFIRFYFAISEQGGDITLVAEGLDGVKQQIGFGSLLQTATGAGARHSHSSQAAHYEERGNGGGFSDSMKALLEEFNRTHPPINGEVVMSEFLKYLNDMKGREMDDKNVQKVAMV